MIIAAELDVAVVVHLQAKAKIVADREGILKFAKIGALLNAPELGISLARQLRTATAGAAAIAQNIGTSQRGDLATAFETGGNVDETLASQIRSGQELTSILDEQAIIQEFLEQKELNKLTNSQRSETNLKTLNSIWLEIQRNTGKSADEIVPLNEAAEQQREKLNEVFNQWVQINEQARAYQDILLDISNTDISATTAGILAAIDAASDITGTTFGLSDDGKIFVKR